MRSDDKEVTGTYEFSTILLQTVIFCPLGREEGTAGIWKAIRECVALADHVESRLSSELGFHAYRRQIDALPRPEDGGKDFACSLFARHDRKSSRWIGSEYDCRFIFNLDSRSEEVSNAKKRIWIADHWFDDLAEAEDFIITYTKETMERRHAEACGRTSILRFRC